MASPRASAQDPSAGADPDWQRARRPEHKAERRSAILSAAVCLLDEQGVEGATLSEIARRAGLSKANCYRYFESREAILLAVSIDETTAWAEALARRLEPLAGSSDVEEVARAFARSMSERPRLCMLISALSSVLERNVSAETVVEFKRAFNDRVFGSSAGLCAALPELSKEQAERFLLFHGLAVAGTWPNANPGPVVEEVLQRAEFAPRRLDFGRVIEEHGRTVLRGLLAGG